MTAPHPPLPHAAHQHDLAPFRHSHAFGDTGEAARSRALLTVTAVTLLTMVVELVAGWWTGSLALTADGWHMGTHAAALGGAVLAMRWSRRARDHEGFAFGGWKIEVLSAYTSALLLAAVALGLAIEAVRSLVKPEPINFVDAMLVAVLGLLVNLASVWLLARAGGDVHGHGHGHGHGAHGHGHGGQAHAAASPAPAAAHGHRHANEHQHQHDGQHDHQHGHQPEHQSGHQPDHQPDHQPEHQPGHQHAYPHAAAKAPAQPQAKAKAHHADHNFRAAYIHVLADAFTSVLAIAALAGGLWMGWRWLDPAVALVGAAVIGQWSWGLLRSTSRALVDATADAPLRQAVAAAIEADGDAKLADLHVWQIGPQAWSAVLSVVADHPASPAAYRARLAPISALRHVTVEVHRCPGAH